MRRFANILVHADLDAGGGASLEHASHFARAAGSPAVHVTHVCEPSEIPEEVAAKYRNLLGPDPETARRLLEEKIAALRPPFSPATRTEILVREGSKVLEILRTATELDADLVVLERGSGDRLEDGDELALKIVRKALSSVLVVPPGSRPEYARILVPVDFSKSSMEGLDVAFAVAATVPGASVTVLHVYSVPAGYHETGQTYEEFAAALRAQAEAEWKRATEALDTRGVPWQIRYELRPQVSRTILAVAEEVDASLIVMTSHGRTVPAMLLLGHVSEIVCERTRRPFLCVKRQGEVLGLLGALLRFLRIERNA